MPHLPRELMLALSLAQGVALLFLWRSAADGTWPSRTPVVAFPLHSPRSRDFMPGESGVHHELPS